MTFVSATQFHVERPWGQRPFSIALCLNSVLNVKVVVATFNQEKALVGAFYEITNLRIGLFEALLGTHQQAIRARRYSASRYNLTTASKYRPERRRTQ